MVLRVAAIVAVTAACSGDGPATNEATPSPTVTTAGGTTIAAPDMGAQWTPVSTDDAVFGPGRVTSVIATAEGYVAAGESCLGPKDEDHPTCRATIWRSTGGASEWSRAFVDPVGNPGASPNGTWFHDVAASDLGYVAVGSTYHVYVSYPVFAVSADGAEWERRQPRSSVVHDTSAPLSVVAAEDAFLVAGQSCELGEDLCSGVIWRSEDGVVWPKVLEDVPGSAFASIERVADRYLAVGGAEVGVDLQPVVPGEGVARIWSSLDGIMWSDASTDPSVFGSDRPEPRTREFAQAIAESDSGIVVAGSPFEELGTAIWFSEDGRSWIRLPTLDVFTDATITGIATSGDLLIAVGALGAEPGLAMAWRSDDGGMTWEGMRIDPALTGDDSRFLDVTISGNLVLAGLSIDGRAAIWKLDLDEF